MTAWPPSQTRSLVLGRCFGDEVVKPGGTSLRPPFRPAPLPALLLELESLGQARERAERKETAVGEEPPGRGQMCSLPATWSLSGVIHVPSERPGHK